MWILLIVLYGVHSVSSEQIYFQNKIDCETTQILVEKRYPGTFSESIKAKCMCIELTDQ